MNNSIIGPIPATRARLVVLENVYHQVPDSQPTVADHVFSRHLDTDEQPYVRKSKVGDQWQLFDSGWLEQCGMLVLVNEEGRFLVQPSDEEREEVGRRVIELALLVQGVPVPFTRVRPRESVRFEPMSLRLLRIRCQAGMAKYTAHLFPV